MDKATPTEWLKLAKYKRITIMDPDGWRGKAAPDFNDEISEEEFVERLNQCTITIAAK